MSRMAVPRRRGGQETGPNATMTITATAKGEFPTHPPGNSARAKVSKAATMRGPYRISEGRASPVTSVCARAKGRQSRVRYQRREPCHHRAKWLNSHRGLQRISDESRSAGVKIAVASSWPDSLPRLCCVGRRIRLRDAVIEFEPATAVIGGDAAARSRGRGFTEGFACVRSSHGSRLTRQPVKPLMGPSVAAVCCSPRQGRCGARGAFRDL